jgi:glyoxylase-like metal-dependent hydrolase (beta-lactamase superfamily II)
MKLFFHYCTFGFSNCYILGQEDSDKPADEGKKQAIIVDPGMMDEAILGFIEKNEYDLAAVLVTHDHLNHVHGIRTLEKIYNAAIYAVNPSVRDYLTVIVTDGQMVNIGPFKIEVISVPGHSTDSAVYRVGRLLFTGDALTAGLVGRTSSSYAAVNQITALRSKVLSFTDDLIVLPGHGPPSTIGAEKKSNVDLSSFEMPKVRHPRFNLGL